MDRNYNTIILSFVVNVVFIESLFRVFCIPKVLFLLNTISSVNSYAQLIIMLLDIFVTWLFGSWL